MLDRTIYEDLPSATFSPESASGPSRFDALGGLTIGQFGQALAPANLSARQAKAAGLLTSGICGPLGSTSSRSDDLQKSLVSRLQAKTQNLGSTLYTMTWKPWVTPSGRSRFRLRASARRISETDCTGWPTPVVRDYRNSCGSPGNESRHADRDLPRAAGLAGWPTVTVADASRGAKDARPWDTGRPLNQIVALAGWPTPMAGTPAQNGNNAAGNNDSSRKTVEYCKPTEPARLTVSGEMLTASRVGRLRAYGNAINVEAARAFVESIL